MYRHPIEAGALLHGAKTHILHPGTREAKGGSRGNKAVTALLLLHANEVIQQIQHKSIWATKCLLLHFSPPNLTQESLLWPTLTENMHKSKSREIQFSLTKLTYYKATTISKTRFNTLPKKGHRPQKKRQINVNIITFLHLGKKLCLFTH